MAGREMLPIGEVPYSAAVDLRFHWVRKKRLQGSDGASDEQSRGYSDLLHNGVIDPTLGELYRFEYVLQAHYEMGQGIEVFGKRVVLVGAGEPGSGRK